MIDKLFGILAFVDVAIVIAMPIGVVIASRRGWPLWKSYGTMVLPYLVYATWAGRMPYLTAYVLTFACLGARSLSGLDPLCAAPWRVWTVGVVLVGILPTLLLWLISSFRHRARA